jgi:hypothetical protein
MAVLLLIGALTLSGCASNYVMKLNNGAQITSVGKPKLKDNTYYYRDAKGTTHAIATSRVREVEPASMASQEEAAQKKKSTPIKPAHKHKWYLLWLA